MLKGILAFGLSRRAIILLGLLVFIGAGLVAFTAEHRGLSQSGAGHSRDHRASARPLGRGDGALLHDSDGSRPLLTPGVDNIRSTSFYGLSFVRVTFKYGVDYYFAYTQAQRSLQQNVSLPGGQSPHIQQSSLVGEVFRYQMVGPPHFGLTNLRTVQDWIVTRRLFTVPGVVAGQFLGRHDQTISTSTSI